MIRGSREAGQFIDSKDNGEVAKKKATTKKTASKPAAKKATKKVAKSATRSAAKKVAKKKVFKKTTKKVAKVVGKPGTPSKTTTGATPTKKAATKKKVTKKIAAKKKVAAKKVAKKAAAKKVTRKTTGKAAAPVAGTTKKVAKKVARKVGQRNEKTAAKAAAPESNRQAETPRRDGSTASATRKVVRKPADSAKPGTERRSSEAAPQPVRRKVVRRVVSTRVASEPEPKQPATPRIAGDHPPATKPDAGPADTGEPKRRKRKRRRGRGRGESSGAAQPATSDALQTDDQAARDHDAPRDVPRSKRRRSTAAPEPGELDRWEEIFEKQTFADLGLRGSVLKGIEACGFKYPTKIQSQLIPLMIAGEDVLGQSRTGTGKTAAFGLPLFHNAEKGKPYQTIILAPTRELAIQIGDELRDLGRFTPIKVGVVYGGQKMNQQQRALEAGPEIIVATPGRLMDVNQRGWLHFYDVKTVVLDEVDRMLDIGFRDDIREILSRMRGEHQTVLVSATISEEIERLARKFMRKDVKRLETVGTSLTVSLVQQHYVSVMPWDKMRMLQHLLTHEEPTMTLVFCNMKRTVDKVTQFLRRKGLDAEAIHGDLPQGMRNAIMRKLHDGKLHMLICSDLAARGLDVEGVSHVVNYDLPEDPEVYIHRVGRTARAGRDGVAWALVSPADGHLLTQIEMLANIHIPEKDMPGFEPGPEPEHIVADRAAQERRLEQVRTAKNRFASSTNNAASLSKAAVSSGRANPFPTGPIPTKLPPRKLGGKIKTARSMKESTPPGLSGGE